MPTHGLYIHVPFCSSRCGYCDFNTYTPGELGARPGTTPGDYLSALEAELDVAAQMWEAPAGCSGVQTVFFGGGTPSILGHVGLTRALRAVKRTLGVAPGAEVTTEANPESCSPEFFDALRKEGFTRVSLGMQSAVGHVLKVLGRQHTPGRPLSAIREAQAAGFQHINVDVIYGTPTETDSDLQRSLDAVLGAGVDHISAYALIVEDGTALARRVRRGELAAPDDDVLAERYQMIDASLSQQGYRWYEVSNWALPGGQCQHNLIYWRGGQWWGAGPGAHGCVQVREGFPGYNGGGLTRTVNAKHPGAYFSGLMGADPVAVGAGHQRTSATQDGGGEPVWRQDSVAQPVIPTNHGVVQPSAASTDEDAGGSLGAIVAIEKLTEQDVLTERIMLGLRLAEGVDVDWGTTAVRDVVNKYVALGLLEKEHVCPETVPEAQAQSHCSLAEGAAQEKASAPMLQPVRIRLTDAGRFLADGIVTDILVAQE